MLVEGMALFSVPAGGSFQVLFVCLRLSDLGCLLHLGFCTCISSR